MRKTAGAEQAYVTELRAAVARGLPALRALGEAASTRRRAPGKWSPREIIGHLIDSAVVNHQRFARAQAGDDLVSPAYDQEAWVAQQQYHDVPWEELLVLWAGLNRHLAWAMAAAPAPVRTRSRARHNLHEIGWGRFAADAPVTLDDLMSDYVDHLAHHLRQILGESWSPHGAWREPGAAPPPAH